MTKELTPTEIASMSEVLAKYMGVTVERLYPENKKEGQSGLHFTFPKDMKLPYSLIYRNCSMESIRYHSSWDWIHEVWEKVREESFILRNALKINDYRLHHKFEQLKETIKYKLFNGTPLEAFTALFHAIEFINKLKQENNGTSSI